LRCICRESSIRHALFASLLVLLAHGALADDDVEDLISRLDSSISTTSNTNDSATATLYLSRAELRRIDRDWQGSLSDLEIASRMNPNLPDLELQRGMTLLGVGRSHEAVVAFNAHLSLHEKDDFAWAQLGRALLHLQLYPDASDAFAKAILLSNRPGPGLYLEGADAIQAQGPSHYLDALRLIDSGIAAIGPAISLELRALELEKMLGRFDQALDRVSMLADGSRSKAPWLLRKGEILLLADRTDEAGHAFAKAKTLALNAPSTRRHTRSNTELLRSIENRLNATIR
jgi:tetratricopeptide (TPR) repeat protein